MPFGYPAFPYAATNASVEHPDYEKMARAASNSSYGGPGSGSGVGENGLGSGVKVKVKVQREEKAGGSCCMDGGGKVGSMGMELEKGRV